MASPGCPDEAVLARAAELYAEGMALEDAHEPQLALDRYRRAVRMADERKILARLQQLDKLGGAAPSGSGGSVAPPPPTASEEEVQLWQAVHISRLEADATTPAPAAADTTSSAQGMAMENVAPPTETSAHRAPKAFAPPPRSRRTKTQDEEDDDRPEDEYPEESDALALRKVRSALRGGAFGRLVSGNEADATSTVGEDHGAILNAMLPEVLPSVFDYLDPYGLDRLARVSVALRQLARHANVWSTLARRVLPIPECDHLLRSSGPGGTPVWRRALLLCPRLRTDGVYIAACGYRRRVQKGASLTDTRESMLIRYHRLLRVLPEKSVEERRQQVLILTYEGELTMAVEALKSHPAGREVTFGSNYKFTGEGASTIRKIHERVILGTYDLDRECMVAAVRYTDERNEYLMEYKLSHAGKSGARQNCRLTWTRYEFNSSSVPQEGGRFDLHREQHYAPYAFAPVRSLEHLL